MHACARFFNQSGTAIFSLSSDINILIISIFSAASTVQWSQYGMPSAHSQFAGYFAMFVVLLFYVRFVFFFLFFIHLNYPMSLTISYCRVTLF